MGKHKHKRRDKGSHFRPPLSLIPTVTPAYAKFRGPSSSAEYNAFFRQAYNDLMNAYLVLQENNEDLDVTNEILVTQQAVDQTQISYLQAALAGLKVNYASLLSFGQPGNQGVELVQDFHMTSVSWGGFPSYYPPSSPMPGTIQATYVPQYGQIVPSLAAQPLSKAYITNPVNGNIILPPGVIKAGSAKLSPSRVHGSWEETDIQNAVDGDSTTYWRRNYYYQQGVTSVTQSVKLEVPYNYVNSLLCNYFTIHPYPEFGLNITSVRMNAAPALGNPKWIELLPTDRNGNPIPISNAGKTRFLFPDAEVASFEVLLQQATPNEVIQPGYETFTLGASVIDFGYMTFNQGVSLVLIPFTLQNNFYNYVTGVGPTVGGAAYNLYYLNAAGDLSTFDLMEPLPAYVSTVYVECQLGVGSGALPVLTNLNLSYWPVNT